jgi:dTDP-glucose 4,6-dehydratase
MKLLVTGGAGFIGSNFVQYMLEKYPEYEVVNLDALTYAGSLDNLKEVLDNPRHRFVQGRIEDGTLVDRLVPGIDVIVNFAAESHVDRSIVEPQVFIKTTVMGTQVLLDAALRHKVKIFYQISTDEVYGALRLDSKERFTEESLLRPNSPYSASKRPPPTFWCGPITAPTAFPPSACGTSMCTAPGKIRNPSTPQSFPGSSQPHWPAAR